MYAAGAYPTLVQNDEHILVKGLQPGHGMVGAYKWGDGISAPRSSHPAGRRCASPFKPPLMACQMLPPIWRRTVQLHSSSWRTKYQHKANMNFLSFFPSSLFFSSTAADGEEPTSAGGTFSCLVT